MYCGLKPLLALKTLPPRCLEFEPFCLACLDLETAVGQIWQGLPQPPKTSRSGGVTWAVTHPTTPPPTCRSFPTTVTIETAAFSHWLLTSEEEVEEEVKKEEEVKEEEEEEERE